MYSKLFYHSMDEEVLSGFKPKKYIVFDLETTGLSNTQNEIIEFSFLTYEDSKLVDTFTSLVRPKELISEKITSITGITNEMVKDSPKIEEFIDKIATLIDKQIVVGHNVRFDIGFLRTLFQNYSRYINIKSIDTRFLSQAVLTDVADNRLETLKNHLGIVDISHRSTNDCFVTQKVFEHLQNKIVERNQKLTY